MFSFAVLAGTVITTIPRGGSLHATVSIINIYKEGNLAIQQAGKNMSAKVIVVCKQCPLLRRGEQEENSILSSRGAQGQRRRGSPNKSWIFPHHGWSREVKSCIAHFWWRRRAFGVRQNWAPISVPVTCGRRQDDGNGQWVQEAYEVGSIGNRQRKRFRRKIFSYCT